MNTVNKKTTLNMTRENFEAFVIKKMPNLDALIASVNERLSENSDSNSSWAGLIFDEWSAFDNWSAWDKD